jgi:hypothetical protein
MKAMKVCKGARRADDDDGHGGPMKAMKAKPKEAKPGRSFDQAFNQAFNQAKELRALKAAHRARSTAARRVPAASGAPGPRTMMARLRTGDPCKCARCEKARGDSQATLREISRFERDQLQDALNENLKALAREA